MSAPQRPRGARCPFCRGRRPGSRYPPVPPALGGERLGRATAGLAGGRRLRRPSRRPGGASLPQDFSRPRNAPPNAHSPNQKEASAFAGTRRSPPPGSASGAWLSGEGVQEGVWEGAGPRRRAPGPSPKGGNLGPTPRNPGHRGGHRGAMGDLEGVAGLQRSPDLTARSRGLHAPSPSQRATASEETRAGWRGRSPPELASRVGTDPRGRRRSSPRSPVR